MKGLPHYDKETRPWGKFERFTMNEPCTVKVLTLNPNEELSLQGHEHRDEAWRVLSGTGRMTVGDDVQEACSGDDFFVSRGTRHRVAAGPNGLTFLEIAFGEFDENDIERFEDRYGRAPSQS